MPTYEFDCPAGHQFEQFHRKISEAPAEVPCPQCGQTATRRISGGAGLVFKGSGFYLTDYGKNAHRKGGAAPKPDAGGEGKSDAKSEPKADAPGGGEKGAGSDAKSESKPAAPKSSGAGPSGGE